MKDLRRIEREFLKPALAHSRYNNAFERNRTWYFGQLQCI